MILCHLKSSRVTQKVSRTEFESLQDRRGSYNKTTYIINNGIKSQVDESIIAARGNVSVEDLWRAIVEGAVDAQVGGSEPPRAGEPGSGLGDCVQDPFRLEFVSFAVLAALRDPTSKFMKKEKTIVNI